MAHVGKKFAFCPVCRLCGVSCVLQLPLSKFLFRNVSCEFDPCDDFSVGIPERRGREIKITHFIADFRGAFCLVNSAVLKRLRHGASHTHMILLVEYSIAVLTRVLTYALFCDEILVLDLKIFINDSDAVAQRCDDRLEFCLFLFSTRDCFL